MSGFFNADQMRVLGNRFAEKAIETAGLTLPEKDEETNEKTDEKPETGGGNGFFKSCKKYNSDTE